MEKAFELYSLWRKQALPEGLAEELNSIENNKEEIQDRFCSHMKFGTSGLRGIMGAGTARMNSVVIKRATLGIADYLLEKRENPVIAISYDTRKNSRQYALLTAEILSKRGIHTLIMAQPQPVPLLSFAVKQMGLNGGIMITASHNPKEYNGYKVYDSKGNQIDDDKARLVEKYIGAHGYFEEIEEAAVKGSIKEVPAEIIRDYSSNIMKNVLWWDEEEACRKVMADFSVTYTPLNGTGLAHAVAVMEALGIGNINIVSRQTDGDGEFTTCPSPDPDNESAFGEALREHEDKQADIILATDPDSDRVGVMVLRNGRYEKLSGNQVGELVCDYICSCRNDLEGKWMFKSLASSPAVEIIAKSHGLNVGNTLTGFKNIALEMEKLKAQGRENDFVLGFEESLGYLYGTYTRDKDAVMGCQLICLAAAKCRAEGITLADRLQQIYEKYGYIESRTWSKKFEKEKDRLLISELMEKLFKGRMESIGTEALEIDRSLEEKNVFQASAGAHKIMIRPSGTELKLKFYVFAKGSGRDEAAATAEMILNELKEYTEKMINERES